MATPRTTKISQIEQDQIAQDNERSLAVSDLPLNDEQVSNEEMLQNVIAELGGESDAKINVYQLVPGQPNSFVGSFDPVNFSVENIQSVYGEGDYLIHVRAHGTIVTRRRIRIAKQKNPQAALALMNPAPHTDKLLEAMQAGFQAMNNNFIQAIQAMMANQPKPKTTVETLQELNMMRQLLGGDTPKADPFELFQKGIEFSKSMAPREGEPSGGELILEGLKTLAPVFENVAAQRNQQPQFAAPPIPVVPQLPQTENSMPVQNTTEIDEVNLQEKFYLNLLMKNAQANNDPAPYAAMGVDALGVEASLAIANNPEFFSVLAQKLPDSVNHKEWFEEYRLAIIEICNELLTQQTEAVISAETTGTDTEHALSGGQETS